MNTNHTTSRTSLSNFLAAFILTWSVCISFTLHAQSFQFNFYAIDAAGHSDTVTIGYSQGAGFSDPSQTGERNMIRQRINEGLDVRITNVCADHKSTASHYETKQKWITYRCAGEEAGYNLAIYTDHWPVKISWNQALFSDSCHSASAISNIRLNQPFEDGDHFELELAGAESVLITKESLDRFYNPYQQVSFGLLSGKFKGIHPIIIPLQYSGPLQKPGWNLIFNDDFNGGQLDAAKWNISSHNNDGTGDCDPQNGRNIPHNPANVSVGGGQLKIKISADPYDGCDYSAGEVKTFGWSDQFVTFFRKAGYLEIRAKLPIEEAVGAAAWLWTGNGPKYSEIDVWETRGIKNRFTATYHWDHATQGQSRAQSGRRIAVRHLDTVWHPFGPAPFYAETDLSQHFITYGLEWTDDAVTWYVNGVEARNITFNGNSRPYSGYPPEEELALRISAGGDLCLRPNNDWCFPDTSLLPLFLEVDYVRVYIREGDEAVFKQPAPVICEDADKVLLRLSHYPDAAYQFSAPWIVSQAAYPFDVYKMNWILDADGSQPPDQYAPVNLSTVFPSGYIELDTFQIYVESAPQAPTGSIQFEPYNNTCMYRAIIQKQKATDQYLWSINGGNSFVAGVDKIIAGTPYSTFGPVDAGLAYNYRIKVQNACGYDQSYTSFVQSPAGNSQAGCLWKKGSEEGASFDTGIRFPEYVNLVKIFSITGELIYESEFIKFFPDRLSGILGSGLYLVQYLLENGSVFLSQKLIITR